MLATFAILLLLVSVYFFFRKQGPKRIPIFVPKAGYAALLSARIGFYRALTPEQRQEFEQRITEFLDEVTIEGVGTSVTDADRVMIASSAVIPVFAFPGWRYRNLSNVVLYPDTFNHDFEFEGGKRSILGMVGTGFMNGQMILSRTALEKGFSASAGKENTAIHEFVHLVDKADGDTDGMPEVLLPPDYAVPWLKLIHREMHRIEQGKSDINPYALTNEAEFLSVAAEYFFVKPGKLQERHPELYAMLSKLFSQDPASHA